MSKSILYKREHKINDYISIRIPTVGEIMENKSDYYTCISLIVSTPFDMMVQLDDIGIDFTTINEWDLFCILFKDLQNRDLSLVFGDLNFADFQLAVNNQNGNVVLLNPKTGAVIDRAIHDQICNFLRKLLHIEKTDKRPANEEAKRYLIDLNRRKQKRRKKNKEDFQLEEYIIALVNTAEFPYNYETTLNLTIYQFYASLRQIIKKVHYDNLMIGCYAGTVNIKEIDQNELNWISN